MCDISICEDEIINYDSEGISIQGSSAHSVSHSGGTHSTGRMLSKFLSNFFIKNELLLIKIIKKIIYGEAFYWFVLLIKLINYKTNWHVVNVMIMSTSAGDPYILLKHSILQNYLSDGGINQTFIKTETKQ